MLHRIVYVSRAADGVGLRDCYDIIRTAHNRNSARGLTGALLFLDGCFVQVLEGPEQALRERYAAILKDPRHHGLELRFDGLVGETLFPHEWMALRGDADIAPALKTAHGYQPGLPADRFDPPRLLAFVRDCCTAYSDVN